LVGGSYKVNTKKEIDNLKQWNISKLMGLNEIPKRLKTNYCNALKWQDSPEGGVNVGGAKGCLVRK